MFNLTRFPSLKILLPIIVGIVVSVCFYTAIVNFITLVIALITLLIATIVLILKKQNSYVITLLIAVVSFGYSYVSCSYINNKNDFSPLPSHNYYYSGIVNELSASNKTLRVTLSNVAILTENNTHKNLSQKLIVYVKNFEQLSLNPNDTLCLKSSINNTQIITNPFATNLSSYYRYHRVGYTAFASNEALIYHGKNHGFSFAKFAYSINQKLFQLLQLHLTNDELAITTAMLLGNDNFISNDTLDAYKATGLMHILSVSGMHVALIYGGLVWIMSLFKINTRRKIGVNSMCLLLIWSYIFIIGSPIAAVRSAFMISFLILARITSNESNTLNALIASATLLLLYNPLSLMDVGFQLSYLAILGIVVLNPLLKKLYTPTHKIVFYVWELVTVSIAAQLFTTPLLLYYSHSFSNYFLVSNVLCIGLSEIIMYLAIVVAFLSPLPYLGYMAAYLLSFAIKLMNWLTVFIAKLPLAVSSIYSFDATTVALTYLCLALILTYIITKQKHYLLLGMASCSTLLFYSAYNYASTINSATNTVYVQKNGIGIYVKNGTNARLYYTSNLDDKLLKQITEYNTQHYITNFETAQITPLPNYKLKNLVINKRIALCNTKYAIIAKQYNNIFWFNNKYYNPSKHSYLISAKGIVSF
jgi:competence protein ComEC